MSSYILQPHSLILWEPIKPRLSDLSMRGAENRRKCARHCFHNVFCKHRKYTSSYTRYQLIVMLVLEDLLASINKRKHTDINNKINWSAYGIIGLDFN